VSSQHKKRDLRRRWRFRSRSLGYDTRRPRLEPWG